LGGACITVVLRSNEIPGENNALLACAAMKNYSKERIIYKHSEKHLDKYPITIPPFFHSQG